MKPPKPVPKDQEFDVDAVVYYRIWSPYRTASTVRMKMIGYLGSNQSGGDGNSNSPVLVPPHFSFKFKGGDGLCDQTIDYIATSDDPLPAGIRQDAVAADPAKQASNSSKTLCASNVGRKKLGLPRNKNGKMKKPKERFMQLLSNATVAG